MNIKGYFIFFISYGEKFFRRKKVFSNIKFIIYFLVNLK